MRIRIWLHVVMHNLTGKGTILNEQFKNLPVSSQVVMTLFYPLLNKGHGVTTDNFYTSPELAELLVSYKTDIYGTVRLNRKGAGVRVQMFRSSGPSDARPTEGMKGSVALPSPGFKHLTFGVEADV
ncbi:piggyBac transposable element-derived protein 4 [Trichonephila clavipes]|nr:piggyBac transposable element-derived protein 4 [Trichonephila clavipes]